MTVEAFKTIFWWEWAHRFLARSIGVIFALPLVFFWATGRIEKRLRWPLVGILALGGFQGFIGWWMVSSGLSERTEVSQYRLATHLVTACLIFSACVWVMRGLARHSADPAPTAHSKHWAIALLCLVLFQIYLGALVAGLDAGMSYNTWPLMDGALIPRRSSGSAAGLAEFLRKPEDGAVRAPHRCLYRVAGGSLSHGLVAAGRTGNDSCAPQRRAVCHRLLSGRVGNFCTAVAGATGCSARPSGRCADPARLYGRASARLLWCLSATQTGSLNRPCPAPDR
uniref:Cytochrome oxidase assembly protein n=1 Tax=Agrobacterium vitis TaxID=373 RepID=A7XEB8_AGRVI|nr:cytochrome oxidase assembly protein [Agrobacterium vitis]